MDENEYNVKIKKVNLCIYGFMESYVYLTNERYQA